MHMINDVYVILFVQIQPFCLTLLIGRKIGSEFKNSELFPLKALFPEIFAFCDKMIIFFFLWNVLLFFCYKLLCSIEVER